MVQRGLLIYYILKSLKVRKSIYCVVLKKLIIFHIAMKESVVVIRKELGSRLDYMEQTLQALQSVPPVNSLSTPNRSNGQFVKPLTDQPKPASSLTSTPTHSNGQFVKSLTEITNQPVQNDTTSTSLTPPLKQASISTPSPKPTSSISNQLLKIYY